MPNNAVTTLTMWSEHPAALTELSARAAGPASSARRRGLLPWAPSRPSPASRPFSLEAIAPSGMSEDAWDGDRATALWGCSRPETSSTLVESASDRLVYEVVTAYAPPDAALVSLSTDHPDVVMHAVTTCESEYAWTAWFARGRTLQLRETTLDLTDAQWEEWDGEWDLPADWAFDVAAARALATGDDET